MTVAKRIMRSLESQKINVKNALMFNVVQECVFMET